MVTRFLVLILLLVVSPKTTWAQCAMCRTQLENNVSNGDIGIAAGINTGILYLLSLPYLAILVLGYIWFRNSRKNVNKLRQGSVAG